MTPSTCQECHQREAVVHLTEVVDETVTTLHLCSRCAAARGIATELDVTPLGEFLAAISPTAGIPELPHGESVTCTGCGATLADIRASGRVGCPNCWVAFGRPLRDLVRRLHGATRHVGEQYADPLETAPDPEAEHRRQLERLRDALRQAVDAEAFEEAVTLRDRLRAMEGEP